MPAAPRTRSAGSARRPRTSTDFTAKRGDVRSQCRRHPGSSRAPQGREHREPTAAARRPGGASHRTAARLRPRRRAAARRTPSARRDRPAPARAARRQQAATHRSYSPMMRISGSRVMPSWACTRSRVSSMSARMSAGARPAAVDDEVRVLGGDLGAVEPLALEAHVLDQLASPLRPAGSSTRSRPRRAPAAASPSSRLSRCLMSFWISASGRRVQAQPAADQHGARREAGTALYEKPAAAGLNSPIVPSGWRK